jgi:type II secretory pathway pseudopilin PulG
LIELLIVVAIILIIAAIAIPNLLRSRMAANEASAVGSIRTINTAAITYSATYGNGFPPGLIEFVASISQLAMFGSSRGEEHGSKKKKMNISAYTSVCYVDVQSDFCRP